MIRATSSVRPSVKARERHILGKMNKLEQAYEQRLKTRLLTGEIVDYKFEPMKLKLADNTTYTPDFLVITSDGEMQLHEVKGYWEDDARVKIKVAAAIFWMFRFVAVQREKVVWKYEEFKG